MWRTLLDAERKGAGRSNGPGSLLRVTTSLAAGGAIYGAVLGMWRGGSQILFASLKLPLVLLVTCAITLFFLRLTAALLGLPLTTFGAANLTLRAMAIAAIVLASMAPVLWLFTLAAPRPGLSAQTAHNLLFLLHTAAVAVAGCTGTWALRSSLRQVAKKRSRARQVLVIWVIALALVGGEVAWAFRPFVGSIYLPSSFLRSDALEGNVYELVITDIVPHLMKKHAEGD